MLNKIMKLLKFKWLIVAMLFLLFSTVLFGVEANGVYYIQTANAAANSSFGYWDFSGANPTYKKGEKLQVWQKENHRDRKYQLKNAGGGYYYIVPLHSKGKGCIDNAGSKNVRANSIIAWDRKNTENQKWRIKKLGNGNYTIRLKSGWGIGVWTYKNGTQVRLYPDGDSKRYMQWRFVDVNNKPNDSIMIRVPSGGGAKVEVWKYRPKEKDKYQKDEYRCDNIGKLNLGTKYKDERAILVIASRNGYSSGYKVITKPGIHSVSMSRKYKGEEFAQTMWRGVTKYRKGSDGSYYRIDGKVSKKDNFYFPKLEERNTDINNLRKAMVGNLPSAQNDQEAAVLMQKVWKFLATKTKYAMGSAPQAQKAAAIDLFKYCRSKPTAPVSRWPSLSDYARVYKKYGYIPTQNCTAWAQMTASMMSLAGISHDKYMVIKFHYDPSWYVEHWIIGVRLNGKWTYHDPALAKYSKIKGAADMESTPPPRYRPATYDYHHPFEVWTLPGSKLNYVPYFGDPKDFLDVPDADNMNRPL